MTPGDQKSETENLELAIFSKQAHIMRSVLSKSGVDKNSIFYEFFKLTMTYFLDLFYLENHPQSIEIQRLLATSM